MVMPILPSLSGLDAWTTGGCKPNCLQELLHQVHESSGVVRTITKRRITPHLPGLNFKQILSLPNQTYLWATCGPSARLRIVYTGLMISSQRRWPCCDRLVCLTPVDSAVPLYISQEKLGWAVGPTLKCQWL